MKKILLFIICISAIAFTGCVEEPCDNVFCLNDGVPVVQGDDCFCDCAVGFEGPNCADEVSADPCADVTCQNEGTCDDGTCNCPAGFGGDNCEIALCDAVLCESNGGTCVDGACDCPEGFSGTNCEIDDACESVSCLNGGICNLGICDCPPGFTGADCSMDIATAFAGVWEALETCTLYQEGNQFTYISTIEQAMDGSLQIVNFANIQPNDVGGAYFAFAATVDGNTISVPLAEVTTDAGDKFIVSGTGVLSDDANTINWTYEVSADGYVDTCTGTWTLYQ